MLKMSMDLKQVSAWKRRYKIRKNNNIKIIFPIIIVLALGILFLNQNKTSASTNTYQITQTYGLQKDNSFHHGIDISIPEGTPIINQKIGVVTKAEFFGVYGLTVIIDYGDVEALYGHNSFLLVSKGDKVKIGQTIALSGSTGKSSGDHLHIEIRKNGKSVNPYKYLGLQIKEE